MFSTLKKSYLFIFDFLSPPNKKYLKIISISPKNFIKIAKKINIAENFESFFSYKDAIIKDSLQLLKYDKKIDVGVLLGKVCSPFLEEKLENWFMFENFDKPILLPIPISKNKMVERGFNQSEIIAEEILKNLPEKMLEVNNKALKKIRETKNQALTKSKKERLENLKDCFSVDENVVKNRNVIIFDDVITTGATTEEARKVIQKAGAKKIKIVSLAH